MKAACLLATLVAAFCSGALLSGPASAVGVRAPSGPGLPQGAEVEALGRAAEDPLEVRAWPREVAIGSVVHVHFSASMALPVVPADGDVLAAEREAREALRARFSAAPFDELDPAWELLELGPVIVTRSASPLEDGAGRLVAEQRAQLVPFAAGDQALPLAPSVTEAELPRFEVRGELGPDEDAPRDPGGLAAALAAPWELPPAPIERSWEVPASAAAASLALLLLGLVAWRQRGRSPRATGAPLLAIERLATDAAQQSGADAQAAHYPLTALARRAWELHLAERCPRGTTDAEWLLLFGDRLDDPGAWRTWFEDCAAIKYGGAPATGWGLEERARFVLAHVPREAQGAEAGRGEVAS